MTMRIIVIGGDKVAYHLIGLLVAEGHDITAIELRRRICERLADDLEVKVINGDGSNVQTMAMAGMAQADMLVSLTGEDETNLLACQIAKLTFGVNKTVARANNPKNITVMRLLGVDRCFSGTKILADIIDQQINYSGMEIAFDIPGSTKGILEFYLAADSRAVGRTLLKYTFPGDAKVVLLTRPDGTVEMPQGDLVMQAGDRMLVVADVDDFEKIWEAMVDKEAVL